MTHTTHSLEDQMSELTIKDIEEVLDVDLHWSTEVQAKGNKLMQLIDSAITEARIEQDKHSRGDEFLWFMRKLKEYMHKSTSPSYKAFISSMARYEKEYREYFELKDNTSEDEL